MDDDNVVKRLFLERQKSELFLFYPTGSGKTRKALQFAEFLLTSRQIDRIVIVVPHKKLLKNWLDESREFSTVLQDSMQVDWLWSFYRKRKLFFLQKRHLIPTLYILDEIHNLIPKTYLFKESLKEQKKTSLFVDRVSADDTFNTTDDFDREGENGEKKRRKTTLGRSAKKRTYRRVRDADSDGGDDASGGGDSSEESSTEEPPNEKSNKQNYYLFFQKIFVSSLSRIVLGLTATPVSNYLSLELGGYKQLFESSSSLPTLPTSSNKNIKTSQYYFNGRAYIKYGSSSKDDANVAAQLGSAVRVQSKTRTSGEEVMEDEDEEQGISSNLTKTATTTTTSIMFTLDDVIWFADRTILPLDNSIYEQYPCRMPFADNSDDDTSYALALAAKASSASSPPQRHLQIGDKYLQLRDINVASLTNPIDYLPVYRIYNQRGATDELINNIIATESMPNVASRPFKHLVVTYLVDKRDTISMVLKSDRRLRNLSYTFIDLPFTTDIKAILETIRRFNESFNKVILITTGFMNEGLGLRETTSCHILEPMAHFTASETWQMLGRSCRLQSHQLPHATAAGTSLSPPSSIVDTKVNVLNFLYESDKYKHRINVAMRKDKMIKTFFKHVKERQLQKILTPFCNDIWREKGYRRYYDRMSTTISYKSQDEERQSIVYGYCINVASTQSLEENIRKVLLHTDILWGNTTLLRWSREIFDTSSCTSSLILFRRYSSDKSYLLARFLVENDFKMENDEKKIVIISGSDAQNLSRHYIYEKDLQIAREIVLRDKRMFLSMRPFTVKGAKLSSLKPEKIYEILTDLRLAPSHTEEFRLQANQSNVNQRLALQLALAIYEKKHFDQELVACTPSKFLSGSVVREACPDPMICGQPGTSSTRGGNEDNENDNNDTIATTSSSMGRKGVVNVSHRGGIATATAGSGGGDDGGGVDEYGDEDDDDDDGDEQHSVHKARENYLRDDYEDVEEICITKLSSL